MASAVIRPGILPGYYVFVPRMELCTVIIVFFILLFL